jgi:hypothetical protein
MKLATVMVAGLLALGLCGCLRTRHVEESHYTNCGPGPDGQPSSCSHSTHAERSWCGPWLVQPDRARP